MSKASRREFLRRMTAYSALGAGAAPWALNLASLGAASQAQAAGDDYRALVCVFLFGGNDAYNTVLATDTDAWSRYVSVRNQEPESIALLQAGLPADPAAEEATPARLGGVLPIGASARQGGQSFALHPLLPRLRLLYQLRQMAVVANVGPLLRPTSKNDYLNGFSLPSKLFSHNDQQSTWQAFAPEGTSAGWGGRIADLLVSQGRTPSSVFTSISAAGNAVWLSGTSVLQYQVSPSGVVQVGNGVAVDDSADIYQAVRRSMLGQQTATHRMQQDLRTLTDRSFNAGATLSQALPSAGQLPFELPSASATNSLLLYDNPLTGKPTFNSLAQQLQVVARTIEARNKAGVGVKRQVFFVSLGGFDTHDTQNRAHANLMAQLDHALFYFWGVLQQLGLLDAVTTFTASDFGRSFTSNGDGTDHGWGGHHFVMGGAVNGGEIYGRFPEYGVKDETSTRNFFTTPQQITNGVLLPTTSVDQYAASLATWMGVTNPQDILPNLGAFDTGASAGLDFMKA